MNQNLMIFEDNLIPEFRMNLEKYPINIFMEHEANYNELLDNFEAFFGDHIEEEKIAEYCSEICLNISVIYCMLDRMNDIEEFWDRIGAICEGREAYNMAFAKFKLM